MKQGNLESGTFFLGVNYWASSSGIKMWKDWDGNVIDNDIKLLKDSGITVLRVFPLWSDFQPLKQFLDWAGKPYEIRINDDYSKPQTYEEKLGIDVECMERFDDFCEIAEKYGMRLIVPLITGWMSGRCFFPDAFIGKNVVLDPLCIKWEVRYVKYFVERFKNKKNIIAWELGNECNCLGEVENALQAWNWTNAIATTVKSADPTRPFLSGMHSLANDSNWNIEDQSELCDILTVHPYILFTPKCDDEKLLSSRAILHSPAEASLYSDLGKTTCLAEEIGTLGPVFGGENTVSKFIKANLFNAFAHNELGFMWWTSFDQDKLTFAPYEWCDVERELGLFKEDKREKLSIKAYKDFARFLENFPYENLPEREKDAVCLVSSKGWLEAFGSFILSKQAGFDLKYANLFDELPNSKFYIAPCVKGTTFFRKSVLDSLIEKVMDGATLLLTYDGGTISYLYKLIGCEILGRYKSEKVKFALNGKDLSVLRSYALSLKPITAKTIIEDENGDPCLVYNELGKGKVVFFNGALEKGFVENEITDRSDFYEIYKLVSDFAIKDRIIEKTNPNIHFTLHKVEDGYIAIFINNTEKDLNDELKISDDYRIDAAYYGIFENGKLSIPSGDAVVFKIVKK